MDGENQQQPENRQENAAVVGQPATSDSSVIQPGSDATQAIPKVPEAQYFTTPEGKHPASPTPAHKGDSGEITWTASEYILHKKGFRWYMAYVGFTLALGALIFLITRDKISTGFVIVVLLLFIAIVARPPRELTYTLSTSGLQVGQKFYPYGEFKSFALVDEGAFASITFLPMKRFGQPINLYFDPKDEERIIEMISQFLPVEMHELDLLEQVLRRLRF